MLEPPRQETAALQTASSASFGSRQGSACFRQPVLLPLAQGKVPFVFKHMENTSLKYGWFRFDVSLKQPKKLCLKKCWVSGNGHEKNVVACFGI